MVAAAVATPEDEPLLSVEDLADPALIGEPHPGDELVDDIPEGVASNDQWAFEQADRLVKRLPGREGKDRRTEGEVFDNKTLMTLHKLLVHGVLKSLDFPVSTGKEANVFRGTTPGGGYVAVKIFRVNTSTFKHVLQYIQGDERFQGVSKDKRDLVHAWAQKEFRNLRRMWDAGMSVPEPIRYLNNVLVMEYIGVEEGPWPTLKDMGRFDEAPRFWKAIRADFLRAVQDADLVHADLSEFNILVEGAGTRKQTPRVIDVGQAVLVTHPMAVEFLQRDVKNLCSYFRRQRVEVDEQDFLREALDAMEVARNKHRREEEA